MVISGFSSGSKFIAAFIHEWCCCSALLSTGQLAPFEAECGKEGLEQTLLLVQCIAAKVHLPKCSW